MEAGKKCWIIITGCFCVSRFYLIAADVTKSPSTVTWEWLTKSLPGKHLQNYKILLQEVQMVSKSLWKTEVLMVSDSNYPWCAKAQGAVLRPGLDPTTEGEEESFWMFGGSWVRSRSLLTLTLKEIQRQQCARSTQCLYWMIQGLLVYHSAGSLLQHKMEFLKL